VEAIVSRLPDQIIKGVEFGQRIRRLRKPDNIIIAGMGGSGIAGEIFSTLFQSRIDLPIITHHSYGLPDYFTKRSLLILISYSGNTEEVLSTMRQAQRYSLPMIAVTSGGTLSRKKIPQVLIPAGLPPRGAFGYLFTPLPFITARCGLIKDPSLTLTRAAKTLKRNYERLRLRAKDLARRIHRRLPIIYSTMPDLLPVAFRWSCQLNENAKVVAHIASLPEMNHNEVVGLEGLKSIAREAILVLLRGRKEGKRISKRVSITSRIVEQDFKEIIEVRAEECDTISSYLMLIWLGDMISVRLARLRGVDPLAIRRIDRLKEEMRR